MLRLFSLFYFSSPGRLPSLRPARDLTLGATPKLSLSATAKVKNVHCI